MDTGSTGERPTQRPDLSRLSGIDIEKLAKLLGACVLTLYVIGLIAVNGYLFQLDVTDFALVRARFVYTGALLVTSGVLPYMYIRGSVVGFQEILLQPRRDRVAAILGFLRRNARVGLIGKLLMVPAGLIVLLIVINDYKGPEGWWKAAKAILPAYIVGLLICAAVEKSFRSLLRRMGETGTPLLRDTYHGFAAFMVLFCAVTYIIVFMALSYPQIPEQFGGGRPSYVRLLIKEESISGAVELGIPMFQSGLSCKLALIYEGSDGYVIGLPPERVERVVRLNKEMVSGAITKSAPNTLRC